MTKASELAGLEAGAQEAEARLYDLLDLGNRLDAERRRLLVEQEGGVSLIRLVAIKARLEQIAVDLGQVERQIEHQAGIAQRTRDRENRAAARLTGARRVLVSSA